MNRLSLAASMQYDTVHSSTLVSLIHIQPHPELRPCYCLVAEKAYALPVKSISFALLPIDAWLQVHAPLGLMPDQVLVPISQCDH